MSDRNNIMRSEPGAESTVLAKMLRDESGHTAIEYGLITALITLAIIGTLSTISTTLQGSWYEPIQRALQAALGGP